ncbi:MAG TPA: hypothetical protein VEK33_06955 [Terriglobales bacterium]|nr:hypothetical protein [Terriglobales bacterium]
MSKFDIQGLTKTFFGGKDRRECANPRCSAKSKQPIGIVFYEQWFCSPDCFEPAVQQKLVESLSTRDKQEKHPSLRMPLGLVLVSRGILSHEQLKIALNHQRTSGTNFGEVLQELGFATQQQVTAAVAAQWACPVFSIGDRPLPAGVRIPTRLLELYGMLPVHFSETGRKLMVGFITRVQHHMLSIIEHVTSCTATPCFITDNEYRRHLQALAVESAEHELVCDRPIGPAEIAKLVRDQISQTGGEEVRFGMCRDYLWVRLLGHQEIDLLFRIQQD